MGFPYGADEDAAFIIAWLELNNLYGVKLLINTINKIDKKYDGKIKLSKKKLVIDLKKKSVLMKGPGLIDYFSSIIDKEKRIEIVINNCEEPIYFLPLLFKITNKVLFSHLIYVKNKKENFFYKIKKNSVKIGSNSNFEKLKKNQVKIIISKKSDSLKLEKFKQEITNHTIQNNLSKSLKPNSRYWKTLEKIAQRSYVPESLESRLKGAGAKNDND